MTVDELNDLQKIAASVARIEERMDKVERWMDRMDGAFTLTKWVLSFIGASGVAALVVALARS
jgi:hypothetical protein